MKTTFALFILFYAHTLEAVIGNINSYDKLILAIEQKKPLETIKQMLKQLPKSNINLTTLHLFLMQPNCTLEQVTYLVEELHENVNAEGGFKYTPLHYAVSNNNIDSQIISYLIKKGAEINAEAQYGSSPLVTALTKKAINNIPVLLDNGAKPDENRCYIYSPLQQTVLNDMLSAIKLLIDKKADINAQNGKSKNTPLHTSVEVGKLLFVKELLKYGAKNAIRNALNKRPSDLAADNYFLDIQALLEISATKRTKYKKSHGDIINGKSVVILDVIQSTCDKNKPLPLEIALHVLEYAITKTVQCTLAEKANIILELNAQNSFKQHQTKLLNIFLADKPVENAILLLHYASYLGYHKQKESLFEDLLELLQQKKQNPSKKLKKAIEKVKDPVGLKLLKEIEAKT